MLVAVTGAGPLALNIVLPSLPHIAAGLAIPRETAGLVLSLYAVAVALGQLVYGPLSDRYGRRPILLSGLLLFTLGSLGAALAAGLATLLLARAAQSAGGAAGIVLSRAIIRDVHDRESTATALAYLTLAVAITPLIAPVLGTGLDVLGESWIGPDQGWRLSFALCALAGAGMLAVAWVGLRETNLALTPIPSPLVLAGAYGRLLRNPVFTGYTLVFAGQLATFFGFAAGAAFALEGVMGRPGTDYAWWSLPITGAFMTGSLLVGRLERWRSLRGWVVLSLGLNGLATLLLLAGAALGATHPIALFGPMTLFALGNGLGQPNAAAAAVSVDPRLIGTASGLSGALGMGLGALAMAIVGAAQAGADTLWPIALSTVLCVALALLGLRIARRPAPPGHAEARP